jgi:hypothetical protein
MRKFLIKTFIILVPILVGAIMMEVLLRNLPNDYIQKKEYLDQHAFEIETLILGSSHSFYGLNPIFFTKNTFNASHVSQSLDFDFEILKKYESSFLKLNQIILPISYFTLFGRLEEGSEAWRVKNYHIYYGISKSKKIKNYSEVFGNKLETNVKRLFSYYFKKQTNISSTELGWGTNYKSENSRDLIETGKSASKRHTRSNILSDKYQKIYHENIETLKKIIQWSEKKNIKVLLLTPPAYETYREHIDNNQLKVTIESTKELCSEFNNCHYLNLFSNPNFISNDYYDADHLSEIGAEKLSRLINDYINDW